MRTPRSRSTAKVRPAPDQADRAATPAVIVGLDEDPAFVIVRASLASTERRARLAVSGYRPAVRDRVLVLTDGDERYVIGVLRPEPAPERLEAKLPDGASVRVEGGAVEIADERGRLLVRYENGEARIAAPGGDLVLESPKGNVVVRSGKDITLEAASDMSVTARKIVTAATVLAQSAERFEVHAGRLVEKTRDAYREATELAQTRAGRMRQIVEDVYTLFSKRTQLASEDDTSIDGKRVLLG